MITFIKAQLVLIIGSIADFLTTILLIEVFHCWYIKGNIAGNIIGAIVQFILSRNWSFNASKGMINQQLIKFVLMWAGNITLAAIGVYLLTHYLNIHYLVSKLIISVLLGVSYTYLVSKKFVFAQ
jgi:putative flippase GtrA